MDCLYIECLQVLRRVNDITCLEDSPDGIKTAFIHCFNPIGTIFVGKDSIKNLDLSFLHHWERINFTHIRDCKRLKRVVYPSSLKEVSGGLLMNCYDVEEIVILSKDIRFTFGMVINGARSLKRVILYAETPPENTDPSAYFLWFANKDTTLYVPDESVDLYKQVPFYSKFAKAILPMSKYHS